MSRHAETVAVPGPPSTYEQRHCIPIVCPAIDLKTLNGPWGGECRDCQQHQGVLSPRERRGVVHTSVVVEPSLTGDRQLKRELAC